MNSESTISGESIIALAAKLGIVTAGVAICPLLAASPGLAIVASGIVGGAAWDFMKRSSTRAQRSLAGPGRPNHDLEKALGRAVSRACEDFKVELGKTAEEAFRREHNLLRDFTGVQAYAVETFFKEISKSSDFFTIIAKDESLRVVLDREEGSEEQLRKVLSASLGAKYLPDLPDELREWVMGNLSKRIEIRFWEEVKKSPKAWNAYTGEVFRDFRMRLDKIEETTNQTNTLLKQLAAREREIEAFSDAKKPGDGAPIPGDILELITKRNEELTDQLRELNGKIDTVLAGQRMHTNLHFLNLAKGTRIFIGVLCCLAIGAGTLFITFRSSDTLENTGTKVDELTANFEEDKNEREKGVAVDAVKQEAILTEISLRTLEADRKKAEEETGWRKRETLILAAERAHEERIGQMPFYLDLLKAVTGKGIKAQEILNEYNRLHSEHSPQDAFEYLSGKNRKYFEELQGRKKAITEIESRTVLPLLFEAHLLEFGGEYDKAEEIYQEIIKTFPGNDDARYNLVRFLIDFRAPMKSMASERLEVFSLANRHANVLLDRNPEDVIWLRKFSICNLSLADAHLEIGNAELEHEHLQKAYELYQTIITKEPGDPVWQQELANCSIKVGQAFGRSSGNADKALEYFESAAELMKPYVDQPPTNDAALETYGIAVNSKADYFGIRGEFGKMKKLGLEAEKIYTSLIKSDPENEKYRQDLFYVYLNLGWIAGHFGDSDENKRLIVEAESLLNKVVESNSEERESWPIAHQKLLASLAVSKSKSAIQLSEDTGSAVKHLKEALKIRRWIAASDPKNLTWKAEFLEALNGIGVCLINTGSVDDLREGLQFFEEARALAQSTVNERVHAQGWRERYYDSTNFLATTYAFSDYVPDQERGAASKYFGDAKFICYGAIELGEDQKAWTDRLIKTLYFWAVSELGEGNPGRVQSILGESVQLVERLESGESPLVAEMQEKYLDSILSVGAYTREISDPAKAAEMASVVAGALRESLKRNPESERNRQGLAEMIQFVGTSQFHAGEFDAAEQSLSDAIKIWQEFSTENPDEPFFGNAIYETVSELNLLSEVKGLMESNPEEAWSIPELKREVRAKGWGDFNQASSEDEFILPENIEEEGSSSEEEAQPLKADAASQ